MKQTFQDSAHLIRLAVVLVIAIIAFLGLRMVAVPKDFGRYGHYRPAALDSIASRPVAYAGQADCVLCHEAEAKVRDGGKHAGISCEACHGPLAKHAADPSTGKPKLPAVTPLCTSCHEKDAAKPKWFHQVSTKEHNAGMDCNTCHQPHTPKLN